MAINFALKYASKIAEAFTHASFVKGVFKAKMNFTGVKTVRIYRLLTNDETDYQRKGTNRYGEPSDVQDVVDEYTMTQDKAFTGIVDKGDESDQAISGKAGAWLKAQLKERSTPTADKYAFQRMADLGTILPVSAKPTKTTVVSLFADAQEAFDNALVPNEGRFAFVTAEMYKYIAMSDEFVKIEKLGVQSIGRGHVGELFGFQIIKVPTAYLPANAYAVFSIPGAGAMPYKLSDTKIHRDPPGISGALIEGRHYYDFFVMSEKANAMLVAVLSSEQQTTVTLAKGESGGVTAASSGAKTIYYTVDGSDPRFSASRQVYTAAFTPANGATVRAVAYADGKFHSAIAELKYTA